MHRHSRGFTIVELLVVIVVIGILAAISLVSYTGISKNATIAAIQSDLDNAYKKFKLHQTENNIYPTNIELNCSIPTEPTNICLKPSPNNQYTLTTNYTNSSNQIFCLNIFNTSISANYYISSNGVQGLGTCYILTLIATNGVVTGSGAYANGSTQTITATPNTAYLFGSWTGDTGCSGVASHDIIVDANKTCTANFNLDPNWIPGIAATAMAGKYVRSADLGTDYQFKTTGGSVTAPYGVIGTDPYNLSKVSLVSPQINPDVDFSTYPAQNACKAIGGRLPNVSEMLAIAVNKVAYGNNFQADLYWTATDYGSQNVNTAFFVFNTGTGHDYKTNKNYVRCVVSG